MVKELTPEQEALMPTYIEKWEKIGTCTDPCDEKEAERLISEAYVANGENPPGRFIWVDSPEKAIELAAEMNGTKYNDEFSGVFWGQFEVGWLAFYDFMYNVVGLKEEVKELIPLMEASKHIGCMIPFDEVCIVSRRFTAINRDDRGRLHNLNGPAMAYPDGWKDYSIHGVNVAEYVIERPWEITVDDINSERNVEVRRVKLDKFGQQRYIEESGLKAEHQDDFGILYRKQFTDDEDLVMVKVVNSTPEPDGNYKDYWLRVPSEMTRAKEAVAWTFGMSEDEYNPVVET